MKIAGFEISAKRITAAAVTPTSNTVAPRTTGQQTQPTIPLKRSFPRQSLGDSGTLNIHGIITEEYNPQLQGIQGVRIYDQMRKSDGTVRSAMLACTLPIIRASWVVRPVASEDPQDVEIANFVEHALFDWIDDMTWDDILRQALLMLAFGVMVFEKVYGIKDHENKSYVTLTKLAPRLPKSIYQWELADGTFGIQQLRQDGVQAQIPGTKLLIFVNEREGDNWWGTSMLRAAYKHWYYKDSFYKIDAIAFERQGLGVPKITMPAGYTESDERKATQAMQNLRANENAYLLLPPGYEAEFMDMGSSTTRDPEKSINHHNRQILISVLAQFLELGATAVGSKALSSDHSDLFLKAMEAIANTIRDVINKQLIPEMVDLNFDNVGAYPVLDYTGISKVDAVALSTAYGALKTANGIGSIPADEQFFRSLLGLPARTEDDEPFDPSSQDVLDSTKIEEQDDSSTIDTQKPAPTNKDNKKVDKQVDNKKKASSHFHHTLKRKFDDGSGFMSWRPLTFAEKKVPFSELEKAMNDLQDGFSAEAKALLSQAKDAFMSKLHAAAGESDTKAIADLEFKFLNEYKAIVKTAMKKSYNYGKNKASNEMGIASPANSAASMANIDVMADTIANKTLVDLATRAKVSVVNSLKTNRSTLQVVGEIDSALDEAIDKAIQNTGGIIVGQNINNGRGDVFERNIGLIHALQRSEILDKETCNFCLSMDGLVVDPSDDWAKMDTFHNNCRGIWVEILKEEEGKPDITGIPEQIADYYGGQPNDLIQPPKPITQPGTLVHEFVKERDAAKKKK